MCRSFWLVSSGQPLLAIEGSIIYGSIVMWGPTYKSCRRSKPSPPSVPPKQYMERPRWWTWYTRKRSLTLTPFWLLKSVLRHCTATLIWNAAKQINRKQVIGAGHRSLRESNRDSGNESSRNHNNDSNNRRSWNETKLSVVCSDFYNSLRRITVGVVALGCHTRGFLSWWRIWTDIWPVGVSLSVAPVPHIPLSERLRPTKGHRRDPPRISSGTRRN